MNKLEPGQELETTIVAVTNDTIFLDLSSKSEGVLDRAELQDDDGNVSVKEGDKIKVFFMGFINGEMKFTTKISGNKASKSMIESAFASGIPVEGVVEKEIKGGYEVKIGGVRAFCPFSQMAGKKRDSDEDFTGRHMTFKIQEYKNDGRNVVVSSRAIMEEARTAQLASLENSIKEGSTVEGTVVSLHNYGAFVDLGGFQALLPVSEISYERVNDISKVLSVGQKVKASVIKTDWKNERVSLSVKALLADPWDEIAEEFPEGTKIDGTISRVADFGVFVNLKAGIDGLVHISELDVEKNTNLKKVFKAGDKLSVIVKGVDTEAKRISLKTTTSANQDDSASEYLGSQDDDGETYNPFAALLKK